LYEYTNTLTARSLAAESFAAPTGGCAIRRRTSMVTMDLVKPWRIIAGLLPMLYGTLVILELQRFWLWLLLACAMIVLAAVVANALDYTFLAVWPAFPGIFCLVACLGALILSLPDYGVVPVTDSDLELWAAALLAGGFIGWGVRTARQFAESY
jgi:hypothetical protein